MIEDLNVRGMTKNHYLAQAISDVGMGGFRRQIEYKTQWCGEQLLVADRFFPSSRLCSVCGTINLELTLVDRAWTCDCGTEHNRDLNAAINLRNLAVRRVPPELVCVKRTNACGDHIRPDLSGNGRRSRNQTLDLSLVDSSRF